MKTYTYPLIFCFTAAHACTQGLNFDSGEASCELYPYACSHDAKIISGDGLFKVLFVPDGCGSGVGDQCRDRVSSWVRNMEQTADGMVGSRPGVFSFYYAPALGFSSEEVKNQTLYDSHFGAHLLPTDSCVGEDFLFGRRELLKLAQTGLMPDNLVADAVVLVSSSPIGRARGGNGMAFVRRGDSARTLEHELGHALFGLGDEYAEFAGCQSEFPSEAAILHIPNLSTQAEPTFWQDLNVEADEGGGRFERCIFRPTSACLMRHGRELCPVCERAVNTQVDRRRGLNDSQAPRIAFNRIFHAGRRLKKSSPLLHYDTDLLVELALYDESAINDLQIYLDDSPQDTWTKPFGTIAIDELSSGWHHIQAFAEDNFGNIGESEVFYFYLSPPALNTSVGTYSQSHLTFDNLNISPSWAKLIVESVNTTQEIKVGERMSLRVALPPTAEEVKVYAYDPWTQEQSEPISFFLKPEDAEPLPPLKITSAALWPNPWWPENVLGDTIMLRLSGDIQKPIAEIEIYAQSEDGSERLSILNRKDVLNHVESSASSLNESQLTAVLDLTPLLNQRILSFDVRLETVDGDVVAHSTGVGYWVLGGAGCSNVQSAYALGSRLAMSMNPETTPFAAVLQSQSLVPLKRDHHGSLSLYSYELQDDANFNGYYSSQSIQRWIGFRAICAGRKIISAALSTLQFDNSPPVLLGGPDFENKSQFIFEIFDSSPIEGEVWVDDSSSIEFSELNSSLDASRRADFELRDTLGNRVTHTLWLSGGASVEGR